MELMEGRKMLPRCNQQTVDVANQSHNFEVANCADARLQTKQHTTRGRDMLARTLSNS